jgi:uncharacterized repeat protein (TIGR01451 family)
MTGIVIVGRGAASGVSVELRQRTNSGADTSIATTTTDPSGTYTFANTPSAPSDAFYYIRFSGGAGMLATWYTFPIIYVSGSEFTVPSVELGDVQLIAPLADQPLSLPGELTWNARSSGETYRLFIYAEGKMDKPVLDSGNLGTGTSYTVGEGGLPDGKYEGIVQVRDAVSGYGQSQNRFRFTVGSASINTPPTVAPVDPVSVATAVPTSESLIEGDRPDVRVKLSADKIAVEKGSRLVYKIEVQNLGAAPAEDVVLTNLLPDSVTINPAQAKTSIGSVGVEGNNVTAHLGVLEPDAKVTIEIPVDVDSDAGSNVSNQASILYEGVSDPVRSNAYIAQVTEALTGQAPTGTPEQTAQAEPTTSTTQPTAQPTASTRATAQPTAKAVATPTKPQSSTMPQTGGAFPIVFAIVLVIITLLARYLRGRSYRRV